MMPAGMERSDFLYGVAMEFAEAYDAAELAYDAETIAAHVMHLHDLLKLDKYRGPREFYRLGLKAVEKHGRASTDMPTPERAPMEEQPPDPISPLRRPKSPPIVSTDQQLHAMTNQASRALALANDPPRVFQSGRGLVRVVPSGDGHPIVEPLTVESWPDLLSRAADWVKPRQRLGPANVAPPRNVVQGLLSREVWPGIPVLRQVAHVPPLLPDGTVHITPGFDAPSGILYAPPPGFDFPPVSDRPTAEEVGGARDLLLEVGCDFPFDSEASRANALALLLSAVLRPFVAGLVRLALVDKPAPRTGATLFVKVASMIATGQEAQIRTVTREEEFEKTITAALVAGDLMIVFDNLTGQLGNDALAAALTAETWTARRFGRNDQQLSAPNHAVWVATGNNLQLRGDLAPRSYRIRMDVQTARPEGRARESFLHPQLLRWVREERYRTN